jgi:hypothetical protein
MVAAMADRTCPNCGAALPPVLARARMVDCAFCGSSIVLADRVVALAGRAGEMIEAPELVRVGGAVETPNGRFEALGHVRYDYGRGHWDEYHGLIDGLDTWLSVDEGDVALQRPVPDTAVPAGGRRLFRTGAQVVVAGRTYSCTEVNSAEAVAFRGQLLERVEIGETHLFANFTGSGGAMVTGEVWDGGAAWFAGAWVDPFLVRPA